MSNSQSNTSPQWVERSDLLLCFALLCRAALCYAMSWGFSIRIWFVHWFVHVPLNLRLFVCFFVCSFVCVLVCLILGLFVHLFVGWFVCSLLWVFVLKPSVSSWSLLVGSASGRKFAFGDNTVTCNFAVCVFDFVARSRILCVLHYSCQRHVPAAASEYAPLASSICRCTTIQKSVTQMFASPRFATNLSSAGAEETDSWCNAYLAECFPEPASADVLNWHRTASYYGRGRNT